MCTDVPCQDGEQLDILAGISDPAAAARLERQLEALDENASRRARDQRIAAAQTKVSGPLPYEPLSEGVSYEYGPGYVAA